MSTAPGLGRVHAQAEAHVEFNMCRNRARTGKVVGINERSDRGRKLYPRGGRRRGGRYTPGHWIAGGAMT